MEIESARPWFPPEDHELILPEVRDVLTSGRFILGKYTQRFEDEFARYSGVKHAVAMNSCTSALVTTLRYVGVEGREVIVPSNTFVATANSVLDAAGSVVFADIRHETLCLDSADVLRRMTGRTAAVIVVHILGLIPPEIEELLGICRARGIPLIEDAAHAHGASRCGKAAGSFGLTGCFSFFPTKVMTAQLGGMLTTEDDDLAAFARSTRYYGSGRDRGEIVRYGNDWLMGEINAILGYYQLRRLDENVRRRNESAKRYDRALLQLGLETLCVPKDTIHSFYKYPVLLPEHTVLQSVIHSLKDKFGVESSSVYVPCHLQPFYRDNYGYGRGLLPVTEAMLDRTICLPMFPTLTVEQQDYVVSSLRATLQL